MTRAQTLRRLAAVVRAQGERDAALVEQVANMLIDGAGWGEVAEAVGLDGMNRAVVLMKAPAVYREFAPDPPRFGGGRKVQYPSLADLDGRVTMDWTRR